MKKYLFTLLIFLFGVGKIYAVEQPENGEPANTYFDDYNFYKCVVEQYNSDNDTEYIATLYSLTDEELDSIYYLSCEGKNICSVKGIEKLKKLKAINFKNNLLRELDLRQNPYIISMKIDDNVKVYDINYYGDYQMLDPFTSIITVDYDVSKLAFCLAYESSNSLCLGYYKFINILLNQSVSYYYLNDEVTNIQSFRDEINNRFETECGGVTGNCTLYDKNSDILVDQKSSEDAIDGASMFLKLGDLVVGENIFKYDNGKNEYKIIINRKDKESNNKINDNLTNKVINPDTGIFTAMMLSFVSICILVFLYFNYYKKVRN